MRHSRIFEILIATRNPGKAREIEAVLSEEGPVARRLPAIHWKTLDDLGDAIPEPAEDQTTFIGNASLKARCYSLASGLWTLADDSGLEVDALAGAPGVMSARFAGLPDGTSRPSRDLANNEQLVAQLKGVGPEQRKARFRCALALADGQRILATVEGTIEGRIIDVPCGQGGFGYDPHFLVPDLGKTTAELAPAEKNRISHRGQALRQMQAKLPELLLALQ